MNNSAHGLFVRRHDEVHAIAGAAAVRDHRNIIGRRQRPDPPQFGQSTAPVNIGLPDGGRSMLEQLRNP